jgi:hypothetical protein
MISSRLSRGRAETDHASLDGATRVRPGRQESIAAALRLLINETFERQADGGTRKTLIGDLSAQHATAHGG